MEQPHHIYVHGCPSGQGNDGVAYHAHYPEYDAYAPQYANAPEAHLTFPGVGDTEASSRTPPSPSDQSASPSQLPPVDEAAGGYLQTQHVSILLY